MKIVKRRICRSLSLGFRASIRFKTKLPSVAGLEAGTREGRLTSKEDSSGSKPSALDLVEDGNCAMPVVEPSLMADDSCWWHLSLVVAPVEVPPFEPNKI